MNKGNVVKFKFFFLVWFLCASVSVKAAPDTPVVLTAAAVHASSREALERDMLLLMAENQALKAQLAAQNQRPHVQDFDHLSFTQRLVLALALQLLLQGLGYCWLREQRRVFQAEATSPAVLEDDDDLSEEYDYLGTEEAMTTKLNLARAYFEMKDAAAAQALLQEILSHQEAAAYHKQAQQLLEQYGADAGRDLETPA